MRTWKLIRQSISFDVCIVQDGIQYPSSGDKYLISPSSYNSTKDAIRYGTLSRESWEPYFNFESPIHVESDDSDYTDIVNWAWNNKETHTFPSSLNTGFHDVSINSFDAINYNYSKYPLPPNGIASPPIDNVTNFISIPYVFDIAILKTNAVVKLSMYEGRQYLSIEFAHLPPTSSSSPSLEQAYKWGTRFVFKLVPAPAEVPGNWKLDYVQVLRNYNGSTPFSSPHPPSLHFDAIPAGIQTSASFIITDSLTATKTLWNGNVRQGELIDSFGGELIDYTWDHRNDYLPLNAIDFFINTGMFKEINNSFYDLIDNENRSNYSQIPPIANGIDSATYAIIGWESESIYIGGLDVWQVYFIYKFVPTQGSTFSVKPNYLDLITGYSRDSRKIPTKLTIKSTIATKLTLSHYQNNLFEGVPKLKSIDWVVKTLDLKPNIPVDYDCKEIVLGTLKLTSATATSLNVINYVPSGVPYPLSALLNNVANLDDLFAYWLSLYTNNIGTGRQLETPLNQLDLSQIKLKVLAANNNYWNNSILSLGADIGTELNHPFFTHDEAKIYTQHLSPQIEGIGTLVMDSPRTIEIHAALNANQYLLETAAIVGTGTIDNPQTLAKHKLDYHIKRIEEVHISLNASQYLKEVAAIPAIIGTGTQENPQIPAIPAKHKLDWYIKHAEKIISIWQQFDEDEYLTWFNPISEQVEDRVSTLGWYIRNIARVLGLRVNGGALIDNGEEDKYYVRKIIDNPQYDKNAYGKNSFGRFGRLTPHLTNSNGKKAFDKVADIPQMIEACFEHVNRSVGIQQGTEIEILNSTTGKKDYYPNQLAMLLDIHSKITEIQLNAKENHNLVTVIAHEVRELFSVLGAAISFKSLYTRYGKLMYIGHQSDKGSILTSLTTLKMNVGMLAGNLLIDRPRNLKNPLERIFAKSSDKKKAEEKNGQTKYF